MAHLRHILTPHNFDSKHVWIFQVGRMNNIKNSWIEHLIYWSHCRKTTWTEKLVNTREIFDGNKKKTRTTQNTLTRKLLDVSTHQDRNNTSQSSHDDSKQAKIKANWWSTATNGMARFKTHYIPASGNWWTIYYTFGAVTNILMCNYILVRRN